MAASSEHPTLRVLQISDTHLHSGADSRMRGVTTYATFKQVLECARRDRRWAPDLVIATGDIVQD
jgi:Icc protein